MSHRSTIRCFVLLVLLGGLAGGAGATGDPPADDSTLTFALVGSGRSSPANVLLNPHGDIHIACERCHTENAWTPLRDSLVFDHSSDTRFTMTGRHAQTNCRSCHIDLRFDSPNLEPNACASCHLDVHQGQLGIGCQDCHNTQDFQMVQGMEIHARTTFPLTGSHLQISCESCHINDADGTFIPLDPSCITCHDADYQATASATVDHVSAGFPTSCESCHNSLSFSTGVAFDHVVVSSGYDLVGAHAMLSCASCHNPGDLTPIFDPVDQNDCLTCHAPDHEAAHPSFPTTCQDCHTTDAFLPATFDHVSASGGFDLVGAHMSLACSSCHVGPELDPIWNPTDQNDCFTCHETEHADEHPNFPTTCLDCHNTTTWEGANFNHDATGFSLVGAHTSLDCASCHTGPDFDPIWIPTAQDDCFTCHEPEHEDEHPNFPTTCLDCHNTTTWEGANFNHDATGFSLVGAHTSLDCSSCHTGPDFEPIWIPTTQDDCFTCHEPEHEDEHPNFPTTCLDCHNTATWEGANFNHDATGFSLVGAHTSLDCASCHTGPEFEPIWIPSGQDDCQTCHDGEGEQAHPGFPTTCQDCHSVDTWAGATFDHDPLFPIYSGRHEGEWASCQTCHIAPDNFSVFSCLTCHEHNQPDTDDQHDRVGGYVYESTACYSCHPDGED